MKWLARIFGKRYEGVDDWDGIRTTCIGYKWRGVVYVWAFRQEAAPTGDSDAGH